jgi:outer membrane protein assembly factor BamD
MVSCLLIAVVALLVFGGCSWFRAESDVEKPVGLLLQEGVKAFDDGQYRSAIKNFEQLKDWYPFSKHAILAELKIADAHYHLTEYAEAILAYEQFEQLHPRNDAIPYVVYQIGRCYYDQVGTVDRDQTAAAKAQEVFERLIAQYPQSEYTVRAEVHLIHCRQKLAAHEFYVGMFYYRAKHYTAALKRFEAVITRHPDVGSHQQALLYIANCKALIEEQGASPAD